MIKKIKANIIKKDCNDNTESEDNIYYHIVNGICVDGDTCK